MIKAGLIDCSMISLISFRLGWLLIKRTFYNFNDI